MSDSFPVYSLEDLLSDDKGQEAIVDKIRSFQELESGWHYGDGRCATEAAVGLAVRLQALLMNSGASEVEVFPDVSGGILVVGYSEDESVEVFCKHNGEIGLLHELDDRVHFAKDDVSAQEVEEYVRELLWFVKWRSVKLSGYFIPNTTAGRGRDSQVWPSRIPQRTVESRSSIPSVLENIVELNADTYWNSTTQTSQATP